MPDVKVDHTDDGKTITLHFDDVLVVTLPVNMLTGLKWKVASYDQKNLGCPEVVVRPPKSGGGMGAGGTVAVFRFPVRARAPASSRLVLELRQGHGQGPVQQTFAIGLRIKE
ncbi:protease inhibitor I42 family protein [Streptomyces sp. B8F3]|uniref:protease inhibitor I42 family protein n=1 Tax=Streptomyces sp. B8F3 TaxID=3153573 RepID=UPI00325F2417